MMYRNTEEGFSFCSSGGADACRPSGRKRGRGRNKKTGVSEDWTDAELAKEMYELSVHEREQVLDDIHGVAQAEEETPEFVAKCLNRFDTAVASLSKGKRKALDRATFQKPSLQRDDNFKLMFLRSDGYNAKAAAERMAKYFTNKQHLFGEEKLVKEITLDDLDEQDMAVFREGSLVELPHRDQTGRPIWVLDMITLNYMNPTSLLRCSWYLMMATTMDDDIAQRKGICQVVYVGMSSRCTVSKMVSTILTSGHIYASLPCRVTSSHQCYQDPNDLQLGFLSAMRVAYGRELRLRMKTHIGSAIEIKYSLMSFGIHCGKIFLEGQSSRESAKQELFHEYMQRRLEEEKRSKQLEAEEESKFGFVRFPRPQDVLIGRGTPYHEHIGNIYLAHSVESRLGRYRDCGEDNFSKTCISMEVVKKIQESGGRFLQKSGSAKEDLGWKIVDYTISRQKVANVFRCKMAKVFPSQSQPDMARSTMSSSSSPLKATLLSSLPRSSSIHQQQQAKRQRQDPHVMQQIRRLE